MIKVENIETWGFAHAIRGMRNPMNSWAKSDSGYGIDGEDNDVFVVGKNDMQLIQKLYCAGTEHRKYLRQIFASMDITAPLYWWKEADTYKIGVTANSCSTMHKISDKRFELDDFSHDHLILGDGTDALANIVDALNAFREDYIRTGEMQYWWQMIQLLPTSYNQRRTITMNYENAVTMIHQRTGHKLDEWRNFVEILKQLPYVKQIMQEG